MYISGSTLDKIDDPGCQTPECIFILSESRVERFTEVAIDRASKEILQQFLHIFMRCLDRVQMQ